MKIAKALALAYCASSILPSLKTDKWWVRIFDFPRSQFAAGGALAGLLYLLGSEDKKEEKLPIAALLLAALGTDAYRIAPYTPLVSTESLPASQTNEARQLSILVANVLQDNDQFSRLTALVKKTNPDLVFLLEVNERWLEEVKEIEESYPHFLKEPLENTYGLALYSRLPLRKAKVNYLVEDHVPSVHGFVELPSGEEVEFYGVHPSPPRPDYGDTTERDAELILVGKKAKKAEGPVIVMGDLNDVAWSHTTRLFRRVSGLLDPRVGRGPFPTFPAAYPFFRFPLDHVFHSASLRLNHIARAESIGSDHFPFLINFQLEPESKSAQRPESASAAEEREAKEKLGKVT